MATINSVGLGLLGVTGSGTFVGSDSPIFTTGITSPNVGIDSDFKLYISSSNPTMQVDSASSLIYNRTTDVFDFNINSSSVATIASTGFNGPLVGNASTSTTLATARSIYGNDFDGSAPLTQIIASTYGGTGNGFTKFSGATTSEKTYTLPNASCTIITNNGMAKGDIISNTGAAVSNLAVGTNNQFLMANSATSTGLQWVDGGLQTSYTSTFDATTSWGAASGGLYTITITAATHGKGTNIQNIVLFETVGGTLEIVSPNTAVFNTSTGDVSFTVSQTPDGRFAGQVQIQGVTVGAGTGYNTVDAAGTPLNQRAILNFGNGLTATDNSGSARTDVVLSPTYTLTTGPAFLAIQNSTATDVTGDGTVYTLGTTVDLTEIFDQANNFDHTTGIFTAPVTGRYEFSLGVFIGDIGAGHNGYQLNLVTSNRTIILSAGGMAAKDGSGNLIVSGSAFVDMNASNTATATISVGGSTKTVDITANQSTVRFSGFLVC